MSTPSDPDRTTPQVGLRHPPFDQTTTPESGQRASMIGAPTVEGYEILAELGHGGMGVVYKARQTGLNRTVAVKMILSREPTTANEIARFLAEAEAVAAIRHPNVVQVYESGTVGGLPFFAMEYLDGGTLAGVLRTGGRMTPSAAAELLAKLAHGVQAVHDLGIVHRDLKPGNVLFDPIGEPKVVDFGLAKRPAGPGREPRAEADLTQTGAVMGTPAYMSPEQAAGKTKFVGPAADVYALGVILYECLTGFVPFRAEDPMQLLLRVLEDDPQPVRERVPDVPRDLEAICLKCLRKEPYARYETAADLAADLDRFRAGESVSARSGGLFGRMIGMLDRSLKEAEFAAYGSAMFWLAGVIFATELGITAAVFGILNEWSILLFQVGRVVAFLGVVSWYRGGRLLPGTAVERQVWAISGGYIIAGFFASLSLRCVLGWAPTIDIQLYQMFAGLTALMFFALGSILWGWCYAFGVVFLAAGFVMAVDLQFAPLVFGITWAGVLVTIGVRLRRLARRR